MEGERRSGGGGFGRGGGFRRRSFNDGPREMHKAVCAECKKECEVPFKPSQDRPVFCKECYFKKKDAENAGSGSPRQAPQGSEEAEESHQQEGF